MQYIGQHQSSKELFIDSRVALAGVPRTLGVIAIFIGSTRKFDKSPHPVTV
jgi:hypothetical protein